MKETMSQDFILPLQFLPPSFPIQLQHTVQSSQQWLSFSKQQVYGDTYGRLWADVVVYRIAKEIQLMKPEQFTNIYLGLVGFHMAKIVLACLGTYLEPSGI